LNGDLSKTTVLFKNEGQHKIAALFIFSLPTCPSSNSSFAVFAIGDGERQASTKNRFHEDKDIALMLNSSRISL
jgi:hypothetical protein